MLTYDKYRLIDLFCGCGGMTRGFVETGRFLPVFANDFDPAALESYRTNFDPSGEHSRSGDIQQVLIEIARQIGNAVPPGLERVGLEHFLCPLGEAA